MHPGQPSLSLCCVAEQSGCGMHFGWGYSQIHPCHSSTEYHWQHGRDGFAAVNPQTPCKEKENHYWNWARGQLPVSGGLATPSSQWSCRVPNSDNQVFYSFPSSLALVRDCPCPFSSSVSADSLLDVYLHGQVMEGHLGHSQCIPEQVLTICLWRLIHSKELGSP